MKKYLSKKKIYVIVLPLLLIGCGGGGGSSSGNGESGNEDNPINLSLDSVISMPEQVVADSDGVMELKLTNPNLLNRISAVGIASNDIHITGMTDQTTKSSNAELDAVLNSAAAAGANKACWDGSTGAVLAPGESCTQYVSARGVAGAQIRGQLLFNAMRMDGSATTQMFPVTINTDFIQTDALKSSAQLLLNTQSTIRPNAETTFVVNNQGAEAVNGVYIDMSGLPDELINTIDWNSLSGGIYNAQKRRIIIPELRAQSSKSISVHVTGQAKTVLGKDKNQANIDNNDISLSPAIKIGGATAKQILLPKMKAYTKPFDITENVISLDVQRQGTDTTILIPNSVAKLTFLGINRDNVPNTIFITPNLSAGSLLHGGDAINIDVSIDPSTASGEYHYQVNFQDDLGETYAQTITVLVDAQTKLANNTASLVLLRKNQNTQANPAIYTDIENIGEFNAYLHQDVTQQFSVSGGGLAIIDSAEAPCSGKMLAPGELCTIGIESTDPLASPGVYEFYSMSNKNIQAGMLGVINLQSSPDEIEIKMTKALPKKIKAGEKAVIQYELHNVVSRDLMLSTLQLPDLINQNTWQCQGAKAGSIIHSGEKATITCVTTGQAGNTISGKVAMLFTTGDIPYESSFIQSEFVNNDDLSADLKITNTLKFIPGGKLNIQIKNDGDSSVQNMRLDLSALGQALYSQLHFNSINAAAYDVKTGILSFSEDLMPKNTIALSFDLPLSQALLNALKAAESNIDNNPATHVIQLTSSNYQTVYPMAEAPEDIVSLSDYTLAFHAPKKAIIRLQNESAQDLEVQSSSSLAQGIALTFPQFIKKNSAVNIIVDVQKNVVPGNHIVDLVLVDSMQQSYLVQFTLDVDPVQLNYAGSFTAYLPDVDYDPTLTTLSIANNLGNDGFDLFPIATPAEAFVIKDANDGHIISSEQMLLVDGEQGQSLSQGLAHGKIATVMLKVIDPALATGEYQIFTQSVENLKGDDLIANVTLESAFANLTITPLMRIPQKILKGHSVTYQATLQNTNAQDIKIVDIEVPANTSMLSLNNKAWNPQQALTLAKDQTATLSFNTTLNDTGDQYQGELVLGIQADGVTHEVHVIRFNTEAVMENYEALSVNDGFHFTQGTKSTLTAQAGAQGLSHFYLDLSNMPVDLYNAIENIQLNGQTINLEHAKIDLGYISPYTDIGLSVSWNNSAANVLKQYKAALEDNSNTHYMILGAANNSAYYPDIKVGVELTDQVLQFDSPKTTTLKFTNNTNSAFDITALQSKLPEGVSIVNTDCTGALAQEASCDVILKASEDAYGAKDDALTLQYQDQVGNNYQAHAKISIARSEVQINVGDLLMPLTTGNPITTPMTLNNLGPFALHTQDLDISDYLSIAMSGLQTNPQGIALVNNQCNLESLAVNGSCSVNIQVDHTASPGVYLATLAESQNNNFNTQAVNFNVISNKGQIRILGDSVISLQGNDNFVKTVTIQNIGNDDLHMSADSVSFSWDQGTDPRVKKPSIEENQCNNITLASGQSCTFNLRGAVQLPELTGKVLGTLTIHSQDGEPLDATRTVAMQLQHQWKSLASSSGYQFTCGIDIDNRLYCWGDNSYGQLGSGDTENQNAPKAVSSNDGFTNTNVISMALGRNHVCAIEQDSRTKIYELFCWGDNAHGQLGISDTNIQTRPKKVLVANKQVHGVSAGAYHSCAVTTDDKLYCWGANDRGQLGRGNTTDTSTPTGVSFTNQAVQSVSAAQKQTCAIIKNQTQQNQLFCWGDNTYGQIGVNTSGNFYSSPTAVTRLINPDQISVGGYHVCAINTTKQLSCWGKNDRGQLGVGSTTDKKIPTIVSEANGFTQGQALEIATGDYHSCLLNNAGEMYCWGRNNKAQLGLDTPPTQTAKIPQKVLENDGFSQGSVAEIYTGYETSCAIDTSKKLYCWGSNSKGQLGVSLAIGGTLGKPVAVQPPQN